MQKEIWKQVPGLEGLCLASNQGRIKSLSRSYIDARGHHCRTKELILTPWKRGRLSYYCVEICGKAYTVHRLVALAFIPNPENKPEIDHKNRNRFDNNVENLRWVTHTENMRNPYTMQYRRTTTKRGIYAWRYGKCGAENGKSKEVAQYDRNGNFINKFESTRQAGKITGIGYRSICGVAAGKHKTAGGYIWKYI